MSWSHYLLQVNLYLIVFYAFYRLLLAKETYFILNRIYLISAGFFSLSIPFIQVDWLSKQQISQQIYVQVAQLNQLIVTTNNPNAPMLQFNWGILIAMIYLLGATFFAMRFVLQLFAVKKMLTGIKSGLAFSFWNKKVVAQNLPEAATVNHHEDIHIKQLHTFDVVFFELLGIITWFNPVIYLYKETVKSIHEFLADEAAAKFQGDKDAYSLLLLNQAFGVNVNSLTNGFFKKSMIKKRIFMLYKERSKKTAVFKYGLFVPLFAATLLLSSAKIKQNEQILAVAAQVPFDEVKNAVVETIDLPQEKTVNVVIAEPSTEANLKVKDNGVEKFYKFLADNVRYSEEAQANHIQGNLIVNFIVYDKKITSITINPKLGFGTDQEITKVIRAFNAGIFSNGKYSIRIEHRLNGTTTPIINDSARQQPGYIALNTITIMGYAKPETNNKVYSFVSLENPPSYPGGFAEFYKFLGANIKYPADAAENNIQGNVFLSFIVEKDGSITDIKIDRKLGYGTDEEAVRVLKMSRRWNPGSVNGTPVRVKYHIPIKFALNNKPKYGSANSANKVMGERVDTDSFLKGPLYANEKTPLYILDSKPFDGDIKDLNPKEIDAITILKDASAIALYGDKGKNGVVVIVTKKTAKAIATTPIKNN